MASDKRLVLFEEIESKILAVRGQKVMLDMDLARLYGVTTKRFNEQIKRNKGRFPEDFMFQLTEPEAESLRSQTATSKRGRGGRRTQPFAFTEHGAIMAANVLNSPQALEISLFVVRTFVKLRHVLLANKELAAKLNELESKVSDHDASIRVLVDAIRQLMAPQPATPKRKIGFGRDNETDASTPKSRRK